MSFSKLPFEKLVIREVYVFEVD